MPVHNPEIAAALEELADLLELQEANPFRVRAYRNAARVVRGLSGEITAMLRRGVDLESLPGIGGDLAGKIRTLAETGQLPLLERTRKSAPPMALPLLSIPGLGPKRVRTLCGALELNSLEDLRQASREGRVRVLPGFGASSEAKLLEALSHHTEQVPARIKLAVAEIYVRSLLEYLSGAPGVEQVAVAGSYRRCRETVGDIDVLVTANGGARVIRHFTSYPEVARVQSAGTTRATVILRAGLQVDLRVVPAASYGAALHYFTGSKAHNIAIRKLGQAGGLKINEYGVFRGRRRIGGRSEAEVYAAVGLPFIVPELREDRGEIAAAAAHKLPVLVELDDLRGNLHTHTGATDGRNTIEELAAAAQAEGHEYLAITDHSQRLTVVHGLNAKRLLKQIEAIDRLNAELRGFTVLKGIEVDILEDGRLDMPDSVLERLDLVVAAVHSHFKLPRKQQTERILRAMDNRYFTVLAHPTGRLIGEREPYDVDMSRLIKAARRRGCFLELNAQPDRLDLSDLHCRMAKEEGVMVSIASDAHSLADLSNLRYGIGQARRGWLEKADVLNTRSLKDLRKLLAVTTP
jgi:DNA polymerase (family 10)